MERTKPKKEPFPWSTRTIIVIKLNQKLNKITQKLIQRKNVFIFIYAVEASCAPHTTRILTYWNTNGRASLD